MIITTKDDIVKLIMKVKFEEPYDSVKEQVDEFLKTSIPVPEWAEYFTGTVGNAVLEERIKK